MVLDLGVNTGLGVDVGRLPGLGAAHSRMACANEGQQDAVRLWVLGWNPLHQQLVNMPLFRSTRVADLVCQLRH